MWLYFLVESSNVTSTSPFYCRELVLHLNLPPPVPRSGKSLHSSTQLWDPRWTDMELCQSFSRWLAKPWSQPQRMYIFWNFVVSLSIAGFTFLRSWGRVYDCVVLFPGLIFPKLSVLRPTSFCGFAFVKQPLWRQKGKGTDLMECEDIQQHRVCLRRFDPYEMQGSCFIQDLGMIKGSGTTI